MMNINWSAPWLAHLKTFGSEIASEPNWRIAINSQAQQRQIHNHQNLLIQFVSQSELAQGAAYEAHINLTGQVPTRDNLHDFFNALIWLTFPSIKSQLNALQAQQIQQLGIQKSRGAIRDAATLFDENAAILVVTDTAEGRSFAKALRHHQWTQLFIEQREQWHSQVEVFLFGHALMEKLEVPYKGITAHTLIYWVERSFFALSNREKCQQLDQQISMQLARAAPSLSSKLFSPLPVLGVPGWWPDQTVEFYSDKNVFR